MGVKPLSIALCLLAALVLYLAARASGTPFPEGNPVIGWTKYALPIALPEPPLVTWQACAGGSAGCLAGDELYVDPRFAAPWRILDHSPRVPMMELVYLHELGHWFDATMMSESSRNAFQRIAGTGRDWWAPPNAPAEQFAQAFALCMLYPTLPRRPHWAVVVYTWAPSQAKQRATCALIANTTREEP